MIHVVPRYPRVRLSLRIAFTLLLLAAPPARGETATDARLLVTPGAYTIDEVTLLGGTYRRIVADLPRPNGVAGRPNLPARTFLVAIPEGCRARAVVESSDFVDLPGAAIEPTARDTIIGTDATPLALPFRDDDFFRTTSWYPDDLVTVGAPARFRHQLVVPVTVRTFRTIPASGLLRVYRELNVRLVFEKDPSKAPLLTEPVGDEGPWEGVYREALANYDEGRSFRARPARRFAPIRKRNDGDEWKLSVKESALYRIDYEDLAAAGFPAGVPVGQVAVARRGFDDKADEEGNDPFTETFLPVEMDDADGDGFFSDGDRFYAWLPGFREDRMERDDGDRYATEAVYFVTTGGGAVAPETRPGWRDFPGLTPLASFPDSVRWEEDVYYHTPWISSDTVDQYFPFRRTIPSSPFTLEIPAIDTAGNFFVKGMTVSTEEPTPYHRYILIQEATGDTVYDEVVVGLGGARGAGPTFPASTLEEGANDFTFYGFRGTSPGNVTTAGAGGYPDWFEIHADFLYRAREGYLRFSTGKETGRAQIEVEGFADSTILVFDVTDRYAPVLLSPDSVRNDAGAHTLVLQDSVSSLRDYAAATAAGAKRLAPGKIVRSEATDLAGAEAEYIFVIHDSLAGGALADLVAHREAQGTTTVVADVNDIYDEFHGGPKDPRALRRYFRYAYDRWTQPPFFVLLVGDGYEDYKGAAENASGEFDFIPAYPIWETTYHDGADRWTASDPWYVLFDGEYDYLPEIMIGRFPVGNADELRAVVDKTIAYETTPRTESWRRRVHFIADDAWVVIPPYGYAYQTQFETGSKALAARITGDSSLRADTSSLWLSSFTNVYHPLCPDSRWPDDPNRSDVTCVVDLARDPSQGILGAFFDEVNGEGAFLVNYQGHGSRSSLTHELFLVDGKNYLYSRSWHDLSDYSAAGAVPYIFTGYGCNISEFERFSSFNEDALAEVMLLLPETGAVVTYGSTAIEYLGPNLRLNEYVFDHFYPAKTDGAPDLARWRTRTIGELFAGGMADYAAANYAWETARRYLLFADPALRVGPEEPEAFAVAVADTIPDGGAALPPDGEAFPIRFAYASDVWVGDEGILVLDGGQPADSARITVTHGVEPITDRWLWTVDYERPADAEGNEILFRVDDAWGKRTTYTVRLGATLAVTFDGVLYDDTMSVSPVTNLEIEIRTASTLTAGDVTIAAGGFSAAADTLFRAEEGAWIARFDDLVLPTGAVNLLVAVKSLRATYPVYVLRAAVEITATVDGGVVSNGAPLLGHVDGTPPEIVAILRDLRGDVIDSILVSRGDAPVSADEYETTPDSLDGRPALRLKYRPEIGSGDDPIRIEAYSEGAEPGVFLLRTSLPIMLRFGGSEIQDGDFIVGRTEARAEALFAGDLPAEEVRFLLDDAPLPIDTLRKEGNDRWIAVAAIDAGGGDHDVTFRAGAYAANKRVRVENRLRVVEPLCYPNPVESSAGFVYQLTLPADEVRVEIFTIRGLRIRVLANLSGRAGYNENRDVWDGRDQDGDEIARGVYLFRIVASRGGEKAEAIGKIVVGKSQN